MISENLQLSTGLCDHDGYSFFIYSFLFSYIKIEPAFKIKHALLNMLMTNVCFGLEQHSMFP